MLSFCQYSHKLVCFNKITYMSQYTFLTVHKGQSLLLSYGSAKKFPVDKTLCFSFVKSSHKLRGRGTGRSRTRDIGLDWREQNSHTQHLGSLSESLVNRSQEEGN